MLVEHFVEPEFLIAAASKSRNYKDFIREFGRQSPRVIGEIQKFRKFESKVLKIQSQKDVSELAKGRLVEILNTIKEKCLVNRELQYDGEKSYLENFITAHQRIPANVFCMNQPYEPLYGGIEHLFSRHLEDGIDPKRSQLVVRKSINDMVNAVRDFLRLSSKITFVDPYFSDRPAMLNPMIKFIEASCVTSPTKEKHIRILFKSREASPSAQYVLGKITDAQNCKALGLSTLEVISLKERQTDPREKLHNRYIISELGALIWGIGLDEDTSEVSDDVVLMDDGLYDIRYAQYCDLTSFDRADSIRVVF